MICQIKLNLYLHDEYLSLYYMKMFALFILFFLSFTYILNLNTICLLIEFFPLDLDLWIEFGMGLGGAALSN